MAWRVLIAANERIYAVSGWQLRMLARYYEDSDPANIPTPTVFLGEKDFFFDGATLTVQVIQDAVFAEGAKQRLAYTNAGTGTTLPQLQVGQTYGIP